MKNLIFTDLHIADTNINICNNVTLWHCNSSDTMLLVKVYAKIKTKK